MASDTHGARYEQITPRVEGQHSHTDPHLTADQSSAAAALLSSEVYSEVPLEASPAADAPLSSDPALIAALRADLEAAQYTAAHTEALLGSLAVDALRRENPVPAQRVLASVTEPAAVLMRTFVLGQPLSTQEAEAIFPRLGVNGAVAIGLLGPATHSSRTGAPNTNTAGTAPSAPHLTGVEQLRPLMALDPYSASDDAGDIHWWIASDLPEIATGEPLGPEHVLGVGGASLTLARITPRHRIGRVLDLGTGGGIQALHAARHADSVVATDLSERALNVAAFNIALNATSKDAPIELRHGSLLEPVAGEQFDLIVSNPPFVITPRSTDEDPDAVWTYRDGGRAGDALLSELLGSLHTHLAPGGRAALLGNWEVTQDSPWDAHPRSWLEQAAADGVDAWVIQRESEDPAQYSETWVRDGGITSRDPRWPGMIGDWLDDFASRRVEKIGFGYVLLRRAPSAENSPGPGTIRCEEVLGTGSGTLWTHLAQSLDMLATLRALSNEGLEQSRPRRAEDVVERRYLTPGAWDPMLIELVQGAGLARVMPADQVLAAVVGALDDGTLTLGQTLSAVCALTDEDLDQARERVLPQVRELLTAGMLYL